MFSYSTKELAGKTKVDSWNGVISSMFTPLETTPLSTGEFDGNISCVPLGSMQLANVSALPARVRRLPSHISRSSQRNFFLKMQLQGSMVFSQDGKDAHLSEGDMVLCDSSIPYTLYYEKPCSILILMVSSEEIARHLPCPSQVIGVRHPGNQGLAHTASVMLGSVWKSGQEGLDTEVGTRIATALLDVFAVSWMERGNIGISETAVTGSRRTMIKRHIEANLRNPDLSVKSVAAAFGISARYLHMLFPSDGETIPTYTLRRRLEQCGKQLTDPQWKNKTITEIAFAWGFNNATHFARVFRNHYEVSPREYRNSHIGRAADCRQIGFSEADIARV